MVYKKGVLAKRPGDNDLHQAAYESDIERATILLATQPSLADEKNFSGNLPLHIAVDTAGWMGKADMVKLLATPQRRHHILQANNADANPLNLAEKNKNPEIIEWLCQVSGQSLPENFSELKKPMRFVKRYSNKPRSASGQKGIE